jgi:hypothetical protein
MAFPDDPIPFPDWLAGGVTPAMLQAKVTDRFNALVDFRQAGIEAVAIAAGQNSNTGSVTYPVAFPTGVEPYPFTQVAHSAGPQTSVVITSRSETGFTYKVFRCDGSNAGSGGTPSNFYWQTVNS